jgi:hypothetical protein
MSTVTPVYTVGEIPSDPLVIDVVDYNGDAYDLAIYEDVTLVTDAALPAGTTTIYTASTLHHTWTEAFESAGLYAAQVKLTDTSGGKVDFAPPFVIEVVSVAVPAVAIHAIVSPADAQAITRVSLDAPTLVQSQYLIGLAINRSLFEDAWVATLGSQDVQLLKMAVAFNAAALSAGDVSPLQPGVQSASSGDTSVAARPAGVPGGGFVAPLAAMALARLSWRRRNTLRAAPLVLDEWVATGIGDFGPQTLTNDGSDSDWTPIKR